MFPLYFQGQYSLKSNFLRYLAERFTSMRVVALFLYFFAL